MGAHAWWHDSERNCPIKVYMCVYYRGNVALLIYTDEGIFIGPIHEEIDKCSQILTHPFVDETVTPHQEYQAFKMTDQGSLLDCLGVKILPLANRLIKLHQPHMIDQILADL